MRHFPRAMTWCLALCALAVVAAHPRVAAQAVSGDGLPAALKGLKRATGVCRRDDAAPKPGVAAAPTVPPDFACAVSVGALQSMLAQPDTVVVDARGNTAYQAFHIEGALNLSSLDLRSKPYWRSKAVVLVGDGKSERELYSECTRLKRLGYKQVAVLRGGMPLWLAEGQPVAGRAPAAAQLARLSVAEFLHESGNLDNLVILSKPLAALQGDLPFALVLPQMTPESVKAALELHHKERKGVPLSAVVLASDSGMAEQQIEALQNLLKPLPLLVYTDSREAYVRQRAVQKAIWSAQARGPKQPACGL